MPGPKIRDAVPEKSIQNPSVRKRIFISYSHRDSKYAKDFWDHLKNYLDGNTGLDFGSEAVFFDRKDLLAGDEWGESIDQALREVEVTILLVSKNSLNSLYCLHEEVRRTASENKTVIPVILMDCEWEIRLVPGHRSSKMLKDLESIPLAPGKFDVRPVKNWRDRDTAWKQVIREIGRKLSQKSHRPMATPPPDPVKGSGRRLRDLVYLCDQREVSSRFDVQKQQWTDGGAVFFLQGDWVHHPYHVWERLVNRQTGDLPPERQSLFKGDVCLFDLPSMVDFGGSNADIANELWTRLSEKLRSPIRDAIQLRAWFSSLSHPVILRIFPTEDPLPVQAKVLQTFFSLFEGCSGPKELGKLMVLLCVDVGPLVTATNVISALDLKIPRGLRFFDLGRLDPFDRQDVRAWLLSEKVRPFIEMGEYELVDKMFAPPSPEKISFAQMIQKLEELKIIPA